MCFFLSVKIRFRMNCDFRFFINVFHKSVEGSPAFKVVILPWDTTHKEFDLLIVCSRSNRREQQSHIYHQHLS